jgi:hypothetical protein
VVAAKVALFEKLETELQVHYPDLRLVVEDGQPLFRGSFPVSHDGDEIDRFLIEIRFPGGIDALPAIREVGGRIPRDANRHVTPSTGEICTDVPELILLHGKSSLVEYLGGPVRNFFLSQIIFESTKTWPFGQWEHGKDGLLEAYGDLLNVSGEAVIKAYLDYLARKNPPKGHWPCPCGSTKRLRDCHGPTLAVLMARIPSPIARSALKRLNDCP